jgi:DNA-binding CsgD family transcriptional regulator
MEYNTEKSSVGFTQSNANVSSISSDTLKNANLFSTLRPTSITIVKCKRQTSPRCFKRHLSNKRACAYCIEFELRKKKKQLKRDASGLTERQKEILTLYYSNHSFEEIAELLGISLKQVKYHHSKTKAILNINISAEGTLFTSYKIAV